MLTEAQRNDLIAKLPPDKRRLALDKLKERDEIVRYNQWDYYRPYKKQKEFHHTIARERLFEAGNQLGKCILINNLLVTPDGQYSIGSLFGKQAEVLTDKGYRRVLRWIRKPAEVCYRFTMSDGTSVSMPAGHRILTYFGWLSISEILPYLPRCVVRAPGFQRSVLAGVFHYWNTVLGWIGSCLINHRLRDGQFLHEEEGVQVFSPLQDDVLPCNSYSPCLDDLANRQSDNPSPCTHRPSIQDEGGHPCFRLWGQFCSFLVRVVGSTSQYNWWSSQVLQRSSDLECLDYANILDGPGQSLVSCTSEREDHVDERERQSCSWLRLVCRRFVAKLVSDDEVLLSDLSWIISPENGNKIISVLKVGCHTLYDMEVEDRHCYVSAGLIHHNTFAGGMEVAYHLTGLYPAWWKGHRFSSKRPVKFWVSGESGESTRDNPQRILCGNIGEWGTGTIPLHLLGKSSFARGVSDLIDHFKVKHVSGKQSSVFFKSYGKGREKWQGETVDGIWYDEEPPIDIYSEGVTRTNKVLGPNIVTFTPLKGMSEVVFRFHDKDNQSEERKVIQMTIWDVVEEESGHYTKKQAEQIVDAYPDHEKEARALGTPMLGSGRVFPIAEESIRITSDYQIPRYWPQLIGMDFGWGDHPTAAVKGAWNRDADRIILTEEYRRREATDIVSVHASGIRAMGGTDIPVAWPHDGKMGNKQDGTEVATMYRDQFLYMLPEHATFDEGGFGVEPSIQRCFERMKTGRLIIMSHLTMLFDEIRIFHRKDGKIQNIRDDLISAMRYLEMMLRYAQVVSNRFDEDNEEPNYVRDHDRSSICGY